MSVESMAIALHHSRAKGTAKLVLLGIANHDGDGGAWPSQATLAKYAGITDHGAIRKAVNTLISLREVRRLENAGGHDNTPDYLRPNLYHFILECPPYCDRSRQHRDTRAKAHYVPRYLDFAVPPGRIDAPGRIDGGLPDGQPGEPPDSHTGETVIKKPAIEHQAPDLTARARADEKVRSAPSPSESPAGRPACPKRRFMPCAYNAEHICIDCGGIDPQHINPTTGEVA